MHGAQGALPARRRVAGLAALGCAIILAVAGCAPRPSEDGEANLVLAPASFEQLSNWAVDDHAAALDAFTASCRVILNRPADRPMAPRSPVGAQAGDWRSVCEDAGSLAARRADNAGAANVAARLFFEENFEVWAVSDNGRRDGLFTGYFEPRLRGARQPDGRYRWPLYRVPPDLLEVDLGAFDPEFEGRTLVGRLDGARFVPYPDRAAIQDGALDGRALEFIWVDDPIDRFFLEIQGSGQILFADGSTTRVGYAGKNGRAYRAIGRDLIEMGELTREEVSLQTIRAWLKANPERAFDLMNRNESFVFFTERRELADNDGPIGAMGIPLHAGRSLAVDYRLLPLGAPVWLETVVPVPNAAGTGVGERPFQRLLVAQDTGGAIRGPVRGDLFWGGGDGAAFGAGHMKSRGRYYILLPRGLSLPVS